MMSGMIRTTLLLTGTVVVLAGLAHTADDKRNQRMEVSPNAPEEPAGKIVKTEAEWRKQLTAEQFRILRQAGTEPPNGAVYQQFKKQGKGAYHCAGCGTLLFTSEQKFDSGCGWPSFYDPAKVENVRTRADVSHGMTRVEVLCARCDGHLGHVFTGEGFDTPTDKRYCINGVGLRFVPAGEEKPADKEEKAKDESPAAEKPAAASEKP
jgi:peptide-methionine (R)-S-oxide reductase